MIKLTNNIRSQARRIGLGACVLALTAGCDLEVENLNAPDRDRALANPSDLAALISGTFDNPMYSQIWGNNVMAYAVTGPQTSSTTAWQSVDIVSEPRGQLDNNATQPGSTTGGQTSNRDLWAALQEGVSNARDGLLQIADGVMFENAAGDDITPMVAAYSYFLEGVGLGQLAGGFDQAVVVTENEEVVGDAIAFGKSRMLPPDQVLDAAIAALDNCITVSEANAFTFPTPTTGGGESLWFGRVVTTSDTLARVCRSLAARYIIMNARTPTERQAAALWTRALPYLQGNTVTGDWGPPMGSDGFGSNSFIQRVEDANSVITTRMSMYFVGLADQSGGFRTWLDTDLALRNPFIIETNDRRIVGTNPTPVPQDNQSSSNTRFNDSWDAHAGGYVYYDSRFPWTANRGAYLFQWYQWGRDRIVAGNCLQDPQSGTYLGDGDQDNDFPWVSPEEINLYLAEWELRINKDLDNAATLINLTRTADVDLYDCTTTTGNLPAVTAADVAGIPVDGSGYCVPRTLRFDDPAPGNEACGDLFEALVWEQMLNISMRDSQIGHKLWRGMGMSRNGTWVHMPVPGGELITLKIPHYTLGGDNDPTTAVFDPTTCATAGVC